MKMKYYIYIYINICAITWSAYFSFDFDNLTYIIKTDWKNKLWHMVLTEWQHTTMWHVWPGNDFMVEKNALIVFFEKCFLNCNYLLFSWLWNCVEIFATGATLWWEPLIHCGPAVNVLNASDLSTWNWTYGHHHHLELRLQLPMGL